MVNPYGVQSVTGTACTETEPTDTESDHTPTSDELPVITTDLIITTIVQMTVYSNTSTAGNKNVDENSAQSAEPKVINSFDGPIGSGMAVGGVAVVVDMPEEAEEKAEEDSASDTVSDPTQTLDALPVITTDLINAIAQMTVDPNTSTPDSINIVANGAQSAEPKVFNNCDGAIGSGTAVGGGAMVVDMTEGEKEDDIEAEEMEVEIEEEEDMAMDVEVDAASELFTDDSTDKTLMETTYSHTSHEAAETATISDTHTPYVVPLSVDRPSKLKAARGSPSQQVSYLSITNSHS